MAMTEPSLHPVDPLDMDVVTDARRVGYADVGYESCCCEEKRLSSVGDVGGIASVAGVVRTPDEHECISHVP
jgi:hypothetical protein